MDTLKIQAVVAAVFDSTAQVTQGRTTYLRTLIEGAQEVLGNKHRQEASAQLAALNEIHKQFYAIVLKTAERFVPKGTKDRAVELHRLATFARTSVSALRMHVRAGGDLVTLKAASATKASLKAVEASASAPTPGRLKSAVERQGKQLLESLDGLASADKATAINEVQAMLDQLTAKLAALEGGKPARVTAPAAVRSARRSVETGPRIVSRSVEMTRHRAAA